MERKKIRMVALGLIVVVLGALSVGYVLSPKKESGELVVYGNVDIREVDLGFRVFGKVKTLFFEEGDRVLKGDLLAELDAIPYEEQLLEAKAAVLYAEVSLVNAEKQFQRRKIAIMSSAISEEDFENSSASMLEMGASLEQAMASLSSIKTSCEDTRLLAPSDGTLLSRIREPGSVLNPGQPVYTLALDAPIWVRAYVSEPDLGKIFPGMKAKVVTDTVSSPIYEGQIGFISPVAEFTPKNVETTDLRTELVYRIRVVVDKPGPGLRQGMPVTVKLQTEIPQKG